MAIERFELDMEQWAVVPREAAISMLVHVAGISEKQARKHYAELLAAAPRPEAGQQSAPLSDAELVDLIYRAGLGHTSELLYEKSKDGIEVDYPTVEARKLAAFLMRQTTRRPVPTAIPMSERLPVHTDADYSGLILAFTRFTKEWVLQAWTHVHNCPNAYTHWQPTGLTRPAEPDGGAV